MATYYPKYTGKSASIVDALAAVGVNSSYANRKTIAATNGISNYTGTAAQNTQLLNLLKAGKLIKSAGSTPTTTSTTPASTPTTTQSSTNSATPLVVVKNPDGSSIYYPQCASSQLSIATALASIGVDSSYANRKLIASANGISNYTGTVSQNNQLLALLKKGNLKRPTGSPAPASSNNNSSSSSQPAATQPTTTSASNNNTTTTPAVVATQPNNQQTTTNTNPLTKLFMNLSDKQKKALKIGAVVGGVALVGYAAYKATKKSSASASVSAGSSRKAKAALGGVSKRRKRKSTSKRKRTSKRVRKVNLV